MGQVKFTIYGEPKGKGRPRFARMGNGVRTYTPTETANYENLIKLSYLNENRGQRLSGALEARITGFFPVPKSEAKKRKAAMLAGLLHHTKKIDCDNLAKTILDALNDIAYEDDRQVCRLMVEKLYGEEPRVEVTLSELNEEI